MIGQLLVQVVLGLLMLRLDPRLLGLCFLDDLKLKKTKMDVEAPCKHIVKKAKNVEKLSLFCLPIQGLFGHPCAQ